MGDEHDAWVGVLGVDVPGISGRETMIAGPESGPPNRLQLLAEKERIEEKLGKVSYPEEDADRSLLEQMKAQLAAGAETGGRAATAGTATTGGGRQSITVSTPVAAPATNNPAAIGGAKGTQPASPPGKAATPQTAGTQAGLARVPGIWNQTRDELRAQIEQPQDAIRTAFIGEAPKLVAESESEGVSPAPADSRFNRADGKLRADSAAPGQIGTQAGSSPPPSNAELHYQANLNAIKAELQTALKDKPPNADSQTIHDKLVFVHDTMTEAAANKDFALANDYADELAGLLADYRRAVEEFRNQRGAQHAAAKLEYEKKRRPVEASLQAVLKSKPADPASKKILQELQRLQTGISAAVTIGDYLTANKDFDAIPPLLSQFQKQLAAQAAAKGEYQRQFRAIQNDLRKTIDEVPEGAEPGRIHDELADTGYRMESAAASNDFVTANTLLLTITPLIDKYSKARAAHGQEIASQTKAKALYDKKIGPIKAAVDKILKEPPLPDAKTKEFQGEIVSLDMQIGFALTQANYVAANDFVDRLGPLIEQYRAARARAEKDPKVKYDSLWPNIGPDLEGALKLARKDPFMADLQGKLKSKKGELDKAVAKKDYAQAVNRLQELSPMLKQFHEEDRKTPESCIWILSTTAALALDIQIKFNNAANKLDELADAYDRALKSHKDSLQKMKEKRTLSDFLLDIVFMVALPGAIGGAVGNGLKKWLGTAEKTLRGGALVDGTKDTAKFVAKAYVALNQKPADSPPAGGMISGDGVKLTRSVARQLRTEQSNMLAVLRDLDLLVKDHAKDCEKGKPIRIEGDPSKTYADDPFLKIVQGIGAVDEKGFGTEIWREWIAQFAYVLKEKASWDVTKPHYGVGKDFDDDLIPEIQSQVNSGFNVERELENANRKTRNKLQPDGTISDLA